MFVNFSSSSPGTYLLVLKVTQPTMRQIGALGNYEIFPGTYFYVGSAFGPGGLRSRLNHHLKRSAKPHWHIDYLRLGAEIEQIWYTYSARCEHAWAKAFQEFSACTIPIPGFGSSDCSCPAHLFFSRRAPDLQALQATLASGLPKSCSGAVSAPATQNELEQIRSVQCLLITMVPNLHTSRH